jgi:hypothetical protein
MSSAMPEEARKHADAVVMAEAEEIWKQLLIDFESGSMQTTYHSDTLCTMEKMKIPRLELLNRAMYTNYYTFRPQGLSYN